MDTSSSSKVTVEYHDPAGVFSLVQDNVYRRLPLRNLNWQSPSRPLRQIRSLHVDLVPDASTAPNGRSSFQRTTTEDGAAVTSVDIIRGGLTAQQPSRVSSGKQRRHQIPGLKTSPYLKIYVLRCDDKDAYKASERKKIREWLLDAAKSGDQHDAAEWMILHVVVPDTVASSEPRWRVKEHSNEADELKERSKSKVKLPGKSTRTVFDKLRADFNESSKSSPDRIAQIRLRKEDVPADLLPTPAAAETLVETPQERDNAWLDLMAKLKTLILNSFDARVRQYQEDISEKEAQRSLPGWNFNTFFILKEGLAKGLEAVGLIEDALAIYDELAIGLEAVLRDMAAGNNAGSATTFAEHTHDVQGRILGTKLPSTNEMSDDGKDSIDSIARLFGKDYRASIVTSTISVFDFFSYIFLRQKTLILRLANSKTLRFEAGLASKDRGGERGEDLVRLGDVASRTLSFIHHNARALRNDLMKGLQMSESSQYSLSEIEPLVASWSYLVAEQGLSDTFASMFETTASAKASGDKPRTARLPNGTLNRSDFSFGLGANPYPQRLSSLGLTGQRETKSSSDLPSERPLDPNSPLHSPPINRGGDDAEPSAGVPGLKDLFAQRAELVLTKRRMVEALAKRRKWSTGWASLNPVRENEEMRNVMLHKQENGTKDTNDANGMKPPDTTVHNSDLLPSPLARLLQSRSSFYAAYGTLSDQAISFYKSAARTKAAERVMGDLAILKHHQGDHGVAASYFQQILPAFAMDAWSFIETEAIKLYAESLKGLGREEDSLRTVLALLAKVVEKRVERSLLSAKFKQNPYAEDCDAAGLLNEVLDFSSELKATISNPMEWYFAGIVVGQEVLHHDGRDGFSLRIRFRHVLDDTFTADRLSVSLVSVDDMSTEICLSASCVTVQPGPMEITIESPLTAYGPFLVSKVVMVAGKLNFEHEIQPKKESETTPLGFSTIEPIAPEDLSIRRSWIYLYPAENAFGCEVNVGTNVWIDRPRTLMVTISSGWNDIESIELKLKPATAGLRLHLADAECSGIERQVGEEQASKPGTIFLGPLAPNATSVLKIPYTLEHSTPLVSVKIEAQYETPQGCYGYLSTVKLSHMLSLDVDVNDIFQHSRLISTFSIRTMNKIPLCIYTAQLSGTPAYAVQSPPLDPTLVFDQVPGKISYIIQRRSGGAAMATTKDNALALRLAYQNWDELAAEKLCTSFSAALKENGFAKYLRLFVPLLTHNVKRLFSQSVLEEAFITKQLRVPLLEPLGLFEVAQTQGADQSQPLKDCIEYWQRKNRTIAFDPRNPPSPTTGRELTICVDVPTMDVVFTVWMKLEGLRPGGSRHDPELASIGERIQATVVIKHTDQWSSASMYGSASTVKDRTFVLEIQADPDTWIVGGQRRTHFQPGNTDEERSFRIGLVPLKLGVNFLPSIDIQPVAQDSGGQARTPPVTCETNYQNAGKLVQVIKDQHSMRVWISESNVMEIKLPEGPSTASP